MVEIWVKHRVALTSCKPRERERNFFSFAMTVVSHRCSLLIDRSRAEIELSSPWRERKRDERKGDGLEWEEGR